MKDILGPFLLLLLVSATAKAENYNYENRDASPDKTSQGDSTGKSSKKSSQGASKHLFPSWGQRSFRLALDPVAGYRQSTLKNDVGTIDRVETEGGIAGGLYNINIIPGNPGLILHTLAIRGDMVRIMESLDSDAQDSATRLWYGLEGLLPGGLKLLV